MAPTDEIEAAALEHPEVDVADADRRGAVAPAGSAIRKSETARPFETIADEAGRMVARA